MATKDWKKLGKNFWKDTARKESLFSSIKIKSVVVPTSFMGKGERKEYKISFGNYVGDIENYTKYFKTKARALKYAKAYMVKH